MWSAEHTQLARIGETQNRTIGSDKTTDGSCQAGNSDAGGGFDLPEST